MQELIDAFGLLKDKVMYGKKVKGVQRATFIIGPDGVVKKAFPSVNPEGHAEEVLAALKGCVASAGDTPRGEGP